MERSKVCFQLAPAISNLVTSLMASSHVHDDHRSFDRDILLDLPIA